MGMFDSVYFDCPNCETSIEHQSKAGRCFLDVYNNNNVPCEIAVDIENEDVFCDNCQETFKIKADSPITRVKMILVKKEEV